MSIKVSLNTNANPPVTVNPATFQVNRGNQTIEWVPAAQQTFTFFSLTGLEANPPFSNQSVSNSKITLTDDNSSTKQYGYTIVVSANGKQYSTAPSTATAGSATLARAAVGGAAGPIIDNK